jgi:hypothetical protein
MASSKTLNDLSHYKILRPVCGQINVDFCDVCQEKLYKHYRYGLEPKKNKNGKYQRIFALCKDCRSQRYYYEKERKHWLSKSGEVKLSEMKACKDELKNKDASTNAEKREAYRT